MPAAVFVKFDGTALQPIRPVDAKELSRLVVGKPYKAAITKPRNTKVHRLYFKAIAAAAKHWPEHEEPLDLGGDEELLRAHLQCKAGWCTRIYFPVSAKDAVIRLIQEVRATDRFAFVREGEQDGEPCLVVFIPKSVGFDAADDVLFEPVKTDVLARIESVLSVSIQTLIEADENET